MNRSPDEEICFIPSYPSLSDFAKENKLRRNVFLKGIRDLGIIQEHINLPTPEFEKTKLLMPFTFIKKVKGRGRKMRISTTKISSEGYQFLLTIVKEHPELFPLKRIRRKA